MPDLAFELDDEGRQLNMEIKGSGLLFSIINEKTVREAINDNFPDLCVFENDVLGAVADFDHQYKHAENPDDIIVSCIVGEFKDAELSVEISDDKMSAKAKLVCAYGGEPLSLKQIVLVVQQLGVKKGLRKEQMIRLVDESKKGNNGQTFEREIARGRSPKNGQDTKFEQLTKSAKDRILQPQKRDGGKVDMRDLGAIISVRKGEVLMKRTPPTDGESGYNILGDVIEAKAGDDVKMVQGDGTEFSSTNQNLLVSTRVGVPKLVENGMVVDEIFQVPKVDVKTGHIEFEGAVVVTGDVSDGMKIIAKGDVTVGGFVDSAHIESGGDVIIQQAIIGRQTKSEEMSEDEELTTVIKAEGEITAKNAQYSELHANKGISINNQMLHCRVDTSTVWVGGANKANGKVIGGRYKLQSELQTGTLGAPAGSKINVSFDDVLAPFDKKSDEMLVKINEAKEEMDEVKSALDRIKKAPKTEQTKDVVEKAVNTYRHRFQEYGQLLAERDVLLLEKEELVASLKMVANDKVYQGVIVKIVKDKLNTNREYGPSRIFYEGRKVKIDPLV